MFLDEPYPFYAEAIESSLLLRLPKNALMRLIEQSPVIAKQMMVGLSYRLHGFIRDVERHSLQNATQRVIDYLLQVSVSLGEMTLNRKSQVAHQILQLIRQSPNEILKVEWTERVAMKLGLDKQTLIKELSKKKETDTTGGSPILAKGPTKRPMPTVEEEYLQLFFKQQGPAGGDQLSADELIEERHKRLFSMMKAQAEKTGTISLSLIHDEIPESEREWLLSLFLEEREFTDTTERQEQLIRSIRLNRSRERLAILNQQMKQGVVSPAVIEEQKALLKKVRGSK